MTRRLIYILCLWLGVALSLQAEVVVLRSGQVIKGDILLNNEEVVILRQKDGLRYQYPQTEVVSISMDTPAETAMDTIATQRPKRFDIGLSAYGGVALVPHKGTGATAEVVEVGYFGAGQFIPCEELSAGMVGYITASLKNVKDTRVGDTITLDDAPADEPLPGYRQMNSMVFCGIYPVETNKYDDLKEALAKLKLNDASLSYEPETSQALGHGFRVGFLGLLHMDVIEERIEREFKIEIIATAPSVDYHVKLTNGTMIKVDNPALMPDPTSIKSIEEPIVNVTVLTTVSYIALSLLNKILQPLRLFK